MVSWSGLCVLLMFWYVLVVFLWRLGGVLVVSWWYWGNGIFFGPNWFTCWHQLAPKEMRNFAIGLVCWATFSLFLRIIFSIWFSLFLVANCQAWCMSLYAKKIEPLLWTKWLLEPDFNWISLFHLQCAPAKSYTLAWYWHTTLCGVLVFDCVSRVCSASRLPPPISHIQ
jgi:hypothetical protein